MLRRVFYLMLILGVFIIFQQSLTFGVSKSSNIIYPDKILKAKYPKEKIKITQSVDLDNDKKIEYVILSVQGNLWVIKSNKQLIKVDSGIISDEGLDPRTLFIFSPSSKEKHIVVRYTYFPSNTNLKIYRMNKGKYIKALDIMGDLGVEVKNKQVNLYWKKYKDYGGWVATTTRYVWDVKSKRYKPINPTP